MTDYEKAGYECASRWQGVAAGDDTTYWTRRLCSARNLTQLISEEIQSIELSTPAKGSKEKVALLLREVKQLLHSAIDGVIEIKSQLLELPFVLSNNTGLPRIIAIATEYAEHRTEGESHLGFESWMKGVSTRTELLHDEVWLLPQAISFALLEQVVQIAITLLQPLDSRTNPEQIPRLQTFTSALKQFHELDWIAILEKYIPFDHVLRQDPAGVYSRMDFPSRDRYRRRVVHLSKRSDASELDVASTAIQLAKQSRDGNAEPRFAQRSAHIGYYLIGGGTAELCAAIGYRPSWDEKLRTFMYQHPDDVYIGQVVVFSVFFIFLFTFPLVPYHSTLALLVIAVALLTLPATQGAVDLVNTIVSSLLPAEMLPKVDFSAGIPSGFITLVAIPTLLLTEKQTRDLVHEIEVRYLANHDPHLYFALVSDLPDSLSSPVEEFDGRVKLAASLINALNERYREARGRFFLLHRHRIFNKRQGVWMGWERKRGKLLDLNKLLVGEYDSFPVKAGPVELLHSVRFVITLDSDTKLPPGSAHRMAGTLAHPLNAAIIDPTSRIVTAGYAILQPRVGVSVRSATQSRLASLYSGQTGYDVYTRAVSDAYQDLYGEGSFTGKGIYEVEVLHTVLNRRFPRNALLSHDLIEGAYARVGLVTDVEVIDDFPSHYSAYNRRKHRWVRGDWQILQWLFARVPDESGRLVSNPISTVSRWKIVDNLRRSLVEPVTFALLLAGWFILPGGPLYWTLVTLGLLFLPAIVQLGFSLGRTVWRPSFRALSGTFAGFGQSAFHALLILIFLPHQALLSVDAIIRSLIRSFVTGAHLLEWETAAEAESKTTRPSVVDNYLRMSPLLAAGIALLLLLLNPHSFVIASPILVLWIAETAIVKWLNGSPRSLTFVLSKQQEVFIRKLALRTWRFFLDYSDERNHWLIPDNFEEGSDHQAARVSPTNLGLLLNSRQAALELGYLTLPETIRLTMATLTSLDRLVKHKGHIFNWYSTETLSPLSPRVISSVDSGNLAASLYTLSEGLKQSADKAIVSNRLLFGLSDHLRILSEIVALPALWQTLAERLWALTSGKDEIPPAELIDLLFEAESHQGITEPDGENITSDEAIYWRKQARNRIQEACGLIRTFTPWLLPEHREVLRKLLPAPSQSAKIFALSDMHSHVTVLLSNLSTNSSGEGGSEEGHASSLAQQLNSALSLTSTLLHEIADTAERAFRVAHEMDFQFLTDPQRGLLKIGYELADNPSGEVDGKLFDACYDLLASEARIATFLAVAKGDIGQDSWFKMGRTHVEAYGQASLISWTGTMFEYLMPAIWMRSYPETMMARSLDAAVHAHRAYSADSGRIPWGISECGHAGRDDMGNYGYHAFGIPQLALKWDASAGPVISPYSTCLALAAQPVEALSNLQRMAKMGWVGAYGFYEAADYTKDRTQPELVREWMAHHQGMSLAALLNLLENNIFQDWFHANAHVEAAELILHEKPLSRDSIAIKPKSNAPARTDSLEQKHPSDVHTVT